jgi:DNA-binding Lrp family transcriptional regulator
MELDETKKQILELLRKNPKNSCRRMAPKVGLPTRMVEAHMKALKDAGIIVHIGANQGGQWIIK